MSGIIRIAIGYFVVHRFQRVLLRIGVAYAAVGALVRAASGLGEGMLITGLLLIQLPGLPFAGVLFRELSSSRACQLVPYARLRLLGSLVLAMAGAVLLWPLALSAWGTQARPFGATLMVAFAGATVLVLGAFVASRSRADTGTAGLLVGATVGVGPRALDASGMEPMVLMALASIASLLAWLVFASWYVTTRQVAGVWSRLGWPFERPSTARGTALPSRPLAVASVFSGVWLVREPWRDPRQVLVLVAVAVLIWLGAGLLPSSVVVRTPLPTVLPIVMMSYVWAAEFARRSRFLWLSEGGSRADLFRLCERRSLRNLATSMAAVGAILLALSPHLLPAGVDPAGIVWLGSLIATAAAGGLYLGLMNIEGWRPLDVTVAALLVVTATVGSAVAVDVRANEGLTLAVLALQAAIAMTCRTMAARRWERIDWLRLRPLRWGLQWGQVLNPRKIHGLARRASQVDDAT